MYLEDPSKLSKEWKEYFDNKQEGGSPHSTSSTGGANQAVSELEQALKQALYASSEGANSGQAATDITRILNLYRSYQTVGHEKATVEPLQLIKKYGNQMQIGKRKRLNIDRLHYKFHGFTDAQLD